MDSTPPHLQDKPKAELLVKKAIPGPGQVDALAVSKRQRRGQSQPTSQSPVKQLLLEESQKKSQRTLGSSVFQASYFGNARRGAAAGAGGGPDLQLYPSATAPAGQTTLPVPQRCPTQPNSYLH